MTNEMNDLPQPPWWSSREGRKAARDERRRQRHEEHDAARAPRKSGSPREPITAERLADVALDLIDRHGVEGLTVRSLAQALGVGTMTIYWYVQNKEEVLDLVADRILADVEIPPVGGDWRVAGRTAALAVRRRMMAHARAVSVMVGRGSFGPNGMRMIEQALAIFRAAGFDDVEAADAYFAFSNYVTGFCLMQTTTVAVAGQPDIDRRTYAGMVASYIASLPPGLYPNLQAAAPRIFTASLDDRFAFGVDCLITGLEAKLAAKQAAVAPASKEEK
jgi:TetR/AcrR family tetracycline transcriptional repressor